ncbi:hypothetical protein KIW84_060698 [Lathyrus oleraceus]|uniref:Uncharacterized protein n=1 Tax=Pisum sativum TaxID=3888 RepID=A0A9D4W1L2_PEA|nr:hypothetical protein KIW84_060698 [Pisum sativum]
MINIFYTPKIQRILGMTLIGPCYPYTWHHSPCHDQTMSLRAGLTSSSNNFTYSKVSPEHFENSTTASSGATSYISAVTANFPFLPSTFPCNLNLNSFIFLTLNLKLFAAVSIFVTISKIEHFEVKTEPLFFFSSNKPERSKPEDIVEINSKALKNSGEEESIKLTFDSISNSKSKSSFEVLLKFKPFRNHGEFMIEGILILLSGFATRIFEINLFASDENHGGN